MRTSSAHLASSHDLLLTTSTTKQRADGDLGRGAETRRQLSQLAGEHPHLHRQRRFRHPPGLHPHVCLGKAVVLGAGLCTALAKPLMRPACAALNSLIIYYFYSLNATADLVVRDLRIALVRVSGRLLGWMGFSVAVASLFACVQRVPLTPPSPALLHPSPALLPGHSNWRTRRNSSASTRTRNTRISGCQIRDHAAQYI